MLNTSGKKLEIGIIGEVLKETPTIVTPSGVAGLTFGDEAKAANDAVKALRSNGINTSILVIHQEASNPERPPERMCGHLPAVTSRASPGELDPSIKVIVSAHTHAEYRARSPPRTSPAPHHECGVVRPHPQRHHAAHRRQVGELTAAAPRTRSSATRATRGHSAADVPLLDLPKDRGLPPS
jgi:hypothetical protein